MKKKLTQIDLVAYASTFPDYIGGRILSPHEYQDYMASLSEAELIHRVQQLTSDEVPTSIRQRCKYCNIPSNPSDKFCDCCGAPL